MPRKTRAIGPEGERHVDEHPLAATISCERLATGRLTSIPRCSIGAVTMKMMSRTSITSTSGMTLISASVVDDTPAARRHGRRSWESVRTFGMPRVPYVKFRSAMLRNSSEKSSISVANPFTFVVKWL